MLYLLLSLCIALCAAGPEQWPCTWTAPPVDTPSSTWPDGPHIGDGNQGWVVGGSPGEIVLYGTVHGFWGVSFGANSTMPPLASSSSAAPLGFPGCPAQDCSITVGLTLARVIIASAALGGPGSTWTASLDIATGTATVELQAGDSGLRLQLYQHATAGAGLLTLTSTGKAALADLSVTLAGNRNIRNVSVEAGCGLSSAQPCSPTPTTLPAFWLTKDANPKGVVSPLPITAAAGLAPLGASPPSAATPLATLPYASSEPASDWARGGKVATETVGVTLQLALQPGGSVSYALAMAASNDPGVHPALTPQQAVAARLSNVTLGALPALAASHQAWWAAFYSASSVGTLQGAPETEAFFFSALYALGSGTRAGQTVMDLWSPWRTTDYSAWRSNPTLDYNQQALYSGVYALNHIELAQPMYDMLSQAVADGGPALEAAALGCPGIHLSVDLAPYGLKLGVRGLPQAWGIRSNAVYAAVLHVYHWETSAQDSAETLAWANATAMPYLTAVADFWQCFLHKQPVPGAPDGYRYWSLDDCDGDEGCQVPEAGRVNPVWTLTYLRRALTALQSMAAALGSPANPAWADMLAHLPGTAVGVVAVPGHPPTLTLTAYGEGAVNATATQAAAFHSGQQPGYLHSLWPGETLSPLSEPNATLAAAALNTFELTPWGQDNAFSWMFPAAARAGVPPNITLSHWRRSLLTAPVRANRLYAWGGLCSDSLGAVQYVVDMLVQGREGFLRLFPAWPANASASFTTLRMPGALLVSGGYGAVAGSSDAQAGEVAGGTQWVQVLAEGREGSVRRVRVLSPWQAAGRGAVRVCLAAEGGAGGGGQCAPGAPALPLVWSTVGGMRGGDCLQFEAQAGKLYAVALAA